VPRTGRRPGNQDTREAILSAARAAFAERGFDAASMRLIASAAGVDPALVHHYFGTKEQLFVDSLQIPIEPSKIVPKMLAGDTGRLGERVVTTLVGIWDSPAGAAAVALVRSAVGNERIAAMFRDFLVSRILRRITRELPIPPAEAPLRANLAATQVAGLIMVRYILKMEPLASTAPDVLAALIGPTIQHYLTEPLPLPPA
jgi:AcrR family transcriptional regulator